MICLFLEGLMPKLLGSPRPWLSPSLGNSSKTPVQRILSFSRRAAETPNISQALLCQDLSPGRFFSLPNWNLEDNDQFQRLGEISGEGSRAPAESLVLLLWGWRFQCRFEGKGE